MHMWILEMFYICDKCLSDKNWLNVYVSDDRGQAECFHVEYECKESVD
jgi:hypothetical protein